MTVRSVAKQEIPEKGTWLYEADLKKEDGTALTSPEINSLTLTVHALDAAKTIINGLNAVNILNVGRGTVNDLGHLTVVLTGDDLALVDPAAPFENHIALIQGVYSSSQRFTKHEVLHKIINLDKV
jgi:hypothetical protein